MKIVKPFAYSHDKAKPTVSTFFALEQTKKMLFDIGFNEKHQYSSKGSKGDLFFERIK